MKVLLRIILYLIFFSLCLYEVFLVIPIVIIFSIELRKQRNNVKKLIRKLKGIDLFEGEGLMFKNNAIELSIYGEYGVGESTLWVYNNTKAKILAVDTSSEWINAVKLKANSKDRIEIEWVDLGDLGAWGMPLSYKKRDYIYNYVNSVWSRKEKPQLVLIDGRFRVACFLTSLLNGAPGTKLIFDDYINRPKYHIVEEYIKPYEIFGRQALFIIPDKIDVESIQKAINQFIHVMD